MGVGTEQAKSPNADIEDKTFIVLNNNEKLPVEFIEEVVVVHIWSSAVNPKREGEYAGHVSLEILSGDQRGSWKDKTYISVGPDTENYKDLLKKPFNEYPVKYAENYAEDLKSEGRAPDFTFVFRKLDRILMDKEIIKILEEYPERNQRWTIAGPSFSLGDVEKDYGEFLLDIFHWYIGRHLFFRNYKESQILKDCNYNNTYRSTDPIDEKNKGNTINISCVSLAFQILNAGNLSSTLLKPRDIKKVTEGASKESGNQSVQGMYKLEYMRILRAAGYILEHGLSSFIISPDVLADLLMVAKRNELRELGPRRPTLLVFKNTDTNYPDSKVYTATETIPSEEGKNKIPYQFLVFLPITVSLLATLLYIRVSK